MPKQAIKDPRFRCNTCKDFHSAPSYPYLYQCPVHGYMCNRNHEGNGVLTLLSAGYNKLQIVKLIKELTGLGLKEAKDIVDQAPAIISGSLTYDESKFLADQLISNGAQVSGVCSKNLIFHYWSEQISQWITLSEIEKEHKSSVDSTVSILMDGLAKGERRSELPHLLAETFKLDMAAQSKISLEKPSILKENVSESEAMNLVSGILEAGARVYFIPIRGEESPKHAPKPKKSKHKTDPILLNLLLDSFEIGKIGKEEFLASMRKLIN